MEAPYVLHPRRRAQRPLIISLPEGGKSKKAGLGPKPETLNPKPYHIVLGLGLGFLGSKQEETGVRVLTVDGQNPALPIIRNIP